MTQIFLFSGTTFTVPPDWTSTNKIEGIGGGGSGNEITGGGGAGSGACYCFVSNTTRYSPGQIVSINVGVGGPPGTTSVGGANGGDTLFDRTLSTLVVKGGISSTSQTGASALSAAQCIPSANAFAGGAGTSGSNSNGGGGGGGAAGPFGPGATGGAAGINGGGGGGADGGTAGSSTTGGAGAHGGGSGGAGGTGSAAGAAGGSGTEWLYTVGSGGGGGGGGTGLGGAGGLYGGGGGGGGAGAATGGAGGSGILVITYTPKALVRAPHNITVVNANFFSLGPTTFLVGPVGTVAAPVKHNIFLYNRDFYSKGASTFPVKDPTTGIPAAPPGPPTSSVKWFESPLFQPPTSPKTNVKYAALSHPEEGIEGKYIFVAPATFNWAYDAPIIPSHTFIEKRGATLKGDDGIEQQFIRFFPDGWAVQPFQPPFFLKTNQKIGALSHPEEGIEAPYVFVPSSQVISWGFDTLLTQPRKSFKGLDQPLNIDSTFIRFFPSGWEIQPYQPPAYPTAKQRYQGTKGKSVFVSYSNWVNGGWEIQSVQPPTTPLTKQKIAALSKWEDGIEATYVFVPSTPIIWGWDVQPPPPPHQFIEKRGAILRGIDGIEGTLVNFFPSGWEVQPHQPQHTFIEKRGAILKGDDGIEGTLINFFPSGWEIQPPQPPFRINQNRGTILRGDDGTEGIYINFLPSGWEIQPYQPPHTFFEKKGSILRGIDGIEGNFINFFPSGWEIQPYQPPFYPKTNQKIAAVSHPEDGIEFPFIFVAPTQINWAWEIQSFQPPFYPKTNQKTGALSHSEDGIEFPFIFVPPAFFSTSWEIQSVQPPYKINRLPAFLRGDDGIEYPLINFFPAGWEVQPPPPPHIFIEKRGAILRGDDGTEAPYVRWLNSGWEIQPYQPPFYPKTNVKLGGLSQWEDGIEAPYIFIPPGFTPWAWDPQPWQPPFKVNRIQALLRGDDGIEVPYIKWFNDGWEIQSYQPPHIFFEKRGLILRGDDGIEFPFTRFFPSGWEIQPPQPPFFPTIGRRFGALSHPEDGIEGVYVFVATSLAKNPLGWVVQPWQPPHPRPEKAGAWMFGDSGIENIFTFVPPTIKNFEWLIRARRRGRR